MDVLDDLMSLDEPQAPARRRRLISGDDYHRMAEVGLLPADARVELVEGEVLDMAPMGTRHRSAVMRLSHMLHESVCGHAQVSVQLPVMLDRYNEPEPDLALLKVRDDFYADTLPTGPDCLLVIEVSDTTLAYDVRVKVPLYAQHGIPEVWVLDLAGKVLRTFSEPKDGSYGRATALRSPGVLPLPGLPGCSLDFAGLL